MKHQRTESRTTRRVRLLVLTGGLIAFVFFGATIIYSYLGTLQEQRNRILDHDFPRLVRSTYDRVETFFDPLSRSLDLLVFQEEWQDILDDAWENPPVFKEKADQWSAILGVTDIALVDISREVVYAYWSGEPIQLDPSLERDAWFYQVWKTPEPPERNIAFYYDETVGGRAFFYDILLRDARSAPLGILGALVELEELAQRVQRDLSAGEFVYLVDDDEQILLEISSTTLREFLPVYTTTGIEPRKDQPMAQESMIIPEGYIEASRELEEPIITSDGNYAVGVFALPPLDITARVFLNTRDRVEYVRTLAFRQMTALLITFSVVIGGYLLLIAAYANHSSNQLFLIQRSRAQLDELISVLTHSLGNDLQSLRCSLAGHPSHHQEQLDPILLDMEQVLQNAIYSAQLDEGNSGIFPQPLDLGALRDRLLLSCRAALQGKAQTLKIPQEAPPDSPSPVTTDEDLVFHVLLNLLSNAIKYSPVETEITLADRITDENVEFIVADQGPGFNEQDRSRLFRKYSRLSARPTRGERSTGVGLFVSARLTDRLGGELLLLDELPSWVPPCPGPVGAVWLFRVSRKGQHLAGVNQ
ncbi:Histidine kinase-, DNA gyrase B-, and HSP90-like ATPase [Alkalispirochaeta americana]|uniref:histidine kinase n=2 Tax=Alkalispirochaeta americana TaxID=159291 RepID=A0A1N6PW99_9SPIO|nr:Histidine kinase-, DNA gyrase B-, and HSP90-like ATPase [Alkalispirochaeta americana]